MRGYLWIGLLAGVLASCTDNDEGPGFGDSLGGKGDRTNGQARIGGEGRAASAIAHFFDFTFEAQFLTNSTSSWSVDEAIKRQLFYTVGQLNGDNSVGRMDRLKIDNIQITDDPEGSGMKLVTYNATILVAWAKDGYDAPAQMTYTFKLPRDMSYTGEQDFVDDYKHDCVDWGAHDVDLGSMWYYFRPNAGSCQMDEGRFVAVTMSPADDDQGTIEPSAAETEGKYPEYDLIWGGPDNALKVVAVFGKVEDGATSGDQGISAYNSFVSKMKSLLGAYGLTTDPANVPSSPGVDVPTVTFNAQLPDGKTVRVDAMLIDSVTSPGNTDFYTRYPALTPDADLIAYNGHSGLGQNIRKLASMGSWKAGKYAMVYLNGCDSFAYIDDALAKAHGCFDAVSCLNPDDPPGTKYLDTLVNAMPSYFSNMDDSMAVLVEGLLAFATEGKAQTYEDLLRKVPSSQVVLVVGEQDNAYSPSQPPPAQNVCQNNCGGRHPTFSCYCDEGCAKMENQDCCQADGSAGADRTHVKDACNYWQP